MLSETNSAYIHEVIAANTLQIIALTRATKAVPIEQESHSTYGGAVRTNS